MQPRTLRRRGRFYHRKRSHWRLNLALVLLGAALACVVVVDMMGGPPAPAPEAIAAKPIAAASLAAPLPAPAVPPQPGPTVLADAASAPVPAQPVRPVRARPPVADLAGADARGAPAERAPDAATLARAVTPPPARPQESDEVPF